MDTLKNTGFSLLSMAHLLTEPKQLNNLLPTMLPGCRFTICRGIPLNSTPTKKFGISQKPSRWTPNPLTINPSFSLLSLGLYVPCKNAKDRRLKLGFIVNGFGVHL